jgi:hypothetical protein
LHAISLSDSTLLQLALCLFMCLVFIVSIRRFIRAKSLILQNESLLNTVNYLLAVEEKHCRNNREMHGRSLKVLIRNQVVLEDGLYWNTSHSKSSIAKELKSISVQKAQFITPFNKLFNAFTLGLLK